MIAIWMAVGLVCSLAAAGTPPVERAARSAEPVHLTMGPDPGGHTGDTVTPTTTRTGQPVENGPGPKSDSGTKGSKDDTKQPSQGTGSAPAPANQPEKR
jgi:hypothetical protein